MNLPNKLTVLRIIMVPFFVFFMLTDVGGAANKSYGYAGRKDCKKVQSCNEFRKIYGSFGR